MYVLNKVKMEPLKNQCKDAQTIAVIKKQNKFSQKLNFRSMKSKKLYKKILWFSGMQVSV